MKIKVNSKIIKSLLPCEDRLVNYLKHYNELNFDILEFLALDKITTEDKIWVSVRLMPKELVQRFAMDCASRASTYAAKSVLKSYATYAAQAVSHASSTASYPGRADLFAYDAAYYTALAAYASLADRAAFEERELQLKSIAQLIEESK